MQDILQQLGIADSNGGVSTGKDWIKSKGKDREYKNKRKSKVGISDVKS